MTTDMFSRVIRRLMLFGLIVMTAAGCASSQKRTQLESVARDWCMTIRASQIIPVYPLTQDIQPGDVFLVQMPVDRQQQQYAQNGFLPLDNHLARLHVAGYADFYSRCFLGRPEDAHAVLPLEWVRPSPIAGSPPAPWSMAPGAAFPSYSFSVTGGSGMNLAIPVSGVPVGLSLLGTDAATGTITMEDARTLGVDILSLDAQLRAWVREDDSRRQFIAHFAPPAGQPPRNFLRVVTRIYLTGGLQVTLTDSSQRAAGLNAGLARPLEGMLSNTSSDETTAAAAYENVIERLNALLSRAAPTPGTALSLAGSVRVAAASARTIALSETFNPPLVIGYLAFDVAIDEHGALGSAIPTHALLSRQIRLADSRLITGLLGGDGLLDAHVTRELRSFAATDARARTLLDRLDALARQTVPARYRVYQRCRDEPESRVLVQDVPGSPDVDGLRVYITNARLSLQAFASCIIDASRLTTACEKPSSSTPSVAAVHRDLATYRDLTSHAGVMARYTPLAQAAQHHYVQLLRDASTSTGD